MCFGTSPVSKQRTVPGNGHRQLPAGARIPFGFGFLFLSGYGLSASYRRGGEAYVGRFPRRRLMPFYCFILFFTAVYFAKGVLFGRTYSVCAIVKSLIFGGTIIANGWYLQIQLLLYLMFFATFRVAKESRTQLTATCLECLTLSAALYALDYYS